MATLLMEGAVADFAQPTAFLAGSSASFGMDVGIGSAEMVSILTGGLGGITTPRQIDLRRDGLKMVGSDASANAAQVVDSEAIRYWAAYGLIGPSVSPHLPVGADEPELPVTIDADEGSPEPTRLSLVNLRPETFGVGFESAGIDSARHDSSVTATTQVVKEARHRFA